jgi:hypothetical protein
MALDVDAAQVHGVHRASPGPLAASLRWGLGWTIVVASLGATTACVSSTPGEAPADHDDSYSTCVSALGGMPDAINHHIDACAAVAAAAGAT